MRLLLRNLAAALAAYWRVGGLALVVTLVWCAHYDRWTVTSWTLPTTYGGDALEIFARIAAAAEGDARPLGAQVIRRLGAPFGAHWNAYPSSDIVLLWVIGRLARVVGVFAAANIALLLANLTSALAFYGCARWLRARWEWAMAGAVLFAFTLQSFQRGISHLFLIFSWTVPLALLACGMVARSRRLHLARASGVFCVATGLAIGMSNPYVLFLFLQLLAWALLIQWFGARRRSNLVVGSATLGVTLLAFATVESHLWAFASDTAASSPLVRSYAGTEIYAMKPVEMLVPPPGHRWEPFAALGDRYQRWSELWNGESSMSYLGVVGAAGLLWLMAASVRALLRRRAPPSSAAPVAWVVAFSSLGGITNVFALLTGLVVFRATGRFSIFISALALLFVASRMSRLWRARWASRAAATLVLVVGLVDQLPRGAGPEWQANIARLVASDREFGRRIEARLPRGAMVFQLPVIEFPEAVPPYRLEDYTYFRPYMATHTLRFTYGALKRRCRSDWQRELTGLPPGELARRLERYGFAAVYLHRAAFADGGEGLLHDLATAGCRERIEDPGGEQVVVLLRPVLRPERPVARRCTFGRGWHAARVGEPRWAFGPAALSYFNPHPGPRAARLRLSLAAADERHLRISINNTQVASARIVAGRREVECLVMLAPGVNRIDLESAERPVRASAARNQLRAFALYDAIVSLGPRRHFLATAE